MLEENKKQITTKEFRFKLIEKALVSVVEPLKKVLDESNLGLNELDLAQFEELKIKTSSRYEYLNFFANKLIEIYKTQADNAFWQEYLSLIDAQEDFEYKPKFEKNHIDNAIQNAFYFYFGLYAILPKIYFNKFRRELDDDSFKILVSKSQAFSKAMSIIHFDMFRSFIYSSSQTRTGVATKLHLFEADTFEIADDFSLSLSEMALKRAREHTQKLMEEQKAYIGKEKPTLGCPAKFVKIDADNDLIDLIFQWVERIMERYYFKNARLARSGV